MKVLGEGRFLKLYDEDGWEWVQRHNCTGVAVVLPVNDEGKVIFVEQYRKPVRSQLIEFPAGLVGDIDASEAMITAAQRELEEETGYWADEMEHVARGPVTAGLTDELMDFFVAKKLRKVSEGGGDETEEIIVHEVELENVALWLKEQEELGKMIDVKVYTGLYFLK